MEKILVTGGAGFIGSFLVDELLKRGYPVRIFDNLDSQVHPGGNVPDYLNEDAELIKGDVRDKDRLEEALCGVDVVFHLAAAVGLGQSQYQIKRYVEVNIGGTANLLDSLVNSKNKVRKIIVAASMSSYGEGRYECPECGRFSPSSRNEEQLKKGDWSIHCPSCGKPSNPLPTDEDKEQNGTSIYALTKKTPEEMVLNIGKAYGIPSVSLRFFNVYGPRQSLSNPYTGVAAIFMSRVKNDHSPVIYEDGLQTRDFISIHDIVEANLLSLEKEEADYHAFNVGSGNSVSIKEVASVLSKLYRKDIQPTITGKYRKGDIRHCCADISRIKTALGFEPRVLFEEGMRELTQWAEKAEAEDKFEQAARELEEHGLA